MRKRKPVLLNGEALMVDGKVVKMGYYYTDGTTIYVALENGVPSGFGDATYFAEV